MRRLMLLVFLAAFLALPAAASATALLDDTNVESIHDGGPAPGSEAFGYTATSTGTAASISVYLDSSGGVTVGLYANGYCNQPGTRLAVASNTSNTAGAWNTLTIPAVQINSGTRYWIALGANLIQGETTGTISYRDVGSSGSSLDWSGTGFANPFSRSAQWRSNPVRAYVSTTSVPPVKPVNTALPVVWWFLVRRSRAKPSRLARGHGRELHRSATHIHGPMVLRDRPIRSPRAT
jgi:hypothetical protein